MGILAWLRSVFTAILAGILLLCGGCAEVEVYEDVAQYESYVNAGGEGEGKWNKWGMDESIWPDCITDGMNVLEFKMVYYDPWDAQYLGYLVVEYGEEDYEEEMERLKEYPSTEYVGYYGVVEETTYELAAIHADEYQGFVYALTDGEKTVIYAEQIFCNYFMDLDYGQYIPKEYLLDGFDAKKDNAYQKAKGF